MTAFLALLVAMAAPAVYGPDDRRDVADPANAPLMQEAARSVAVVVPRVRIRGAARGDDPEYYRSLPRTSYKTKFDLCPDERFGEQPAPGYCTAFFVGGDTMVTAGHCLKSGADCANAAFVFDFFGGPGHERPERIARRDVYYCRTIEARALDEESGVDFAVFKLDRPVEDRAPLPVRRSGQIARNAPVTVIGHPNGLPLKITAGGRVRDNSQVYFVVNSDTFSGSSGSPVLSDDGVVEGLVVRGETDFVATEAGCNAVRRCDDSGCRGEDVVRSATFREWVPSGILP